MMRFNRRGHWNIPFCKKPDRFAPAYVTKIVHQVEDAAKVIGADWQFVAGDFEPLITQATNEDLIYCDPPYMGRHVDYFSGWAEQDEARLFELLAETRARFILSTWHHNDYRRNEMLEKYWGRFRVVTRDHFYHTGGKLENRRSVVEALVFNFEASIDEHNHGKATHAQQPELFSAAASAAA